MKLLICTQKVDANDSNLAFFVRWIEEFAKHCEQVTVICLEEGKHRLPANVQVYSLGKIKNQEKKITRFTYALRFWRIIWWERRNYDAVFVHMNPEYVLLGGWLWRCLGKKVGLWYTHRSRRLLRMAIPWLANVFTASQDSFPIQTPKLYVTGHGIDIDRFKPREFPLDIDRKIVAPRVVSIGRVARSKNLDKTIQACALLRDREIDFNFFIIGAPITDDDKKYEVELKELVKQLGLACKDGMVISQKKQDTMKDDARERLRLLKEVVISKIDNAFRKVVFKGHIDYSYIRNQYTTADVMVVQDNSGGQNKVALEAMATGLPILTSNRAYRKVLGNDWEKLSFDVGDTGRLALKMEEIFGMSEDEKKELGRRLRERVVWCHNLVNLIPVIVEALR